MRQFLIAGNWKMHGSQTMTTELIAGIQKGLTKLPDAEQFTVLVCPPAIYLETASRSLQNTRICLGAQTVSEHAKGAYTGEVSLSMLAEFGCQYVLVGHSERRELFAETDQHVAQKFAACLNSENELIPVLCVGESLQQRESGETEALLDRQIDAVLDAVGIAGFGNAVIAYEPVWAIGTGVTASPEQAQQAHQYIRNKLAEIDPEIAAKVQILYGGSMKPENAKELLSQADIDGGLIGGAALKAESFLGICEAAANLSEG